MMRSTPAAFVDRLRSHPKYIQAAARDPVYVEHMNGIEFIILRIYELGDEDAVWLERFDVIRAILSRDELTLNERLLEFGRALETWHVETTRRPGN